MKEEITFLDMLQQKRTTYEETPAPQALQFGAGGANIIDAGPYVGRAERKGINNNANGCIIYHKPSQKRQHWHVTAFVRVRKICWNGLLLDVVSLDISG